MSAALHTESIQRRADQRQAKLGEMTMNTMLLVLFAALWGGLFDMYRTMLGT